MTAGLSIEGTTGLSAWAVGVLAVGGVVFRLRDA